MKNRLLALYGDNLLHREKFVHMQDREAGKDRDQPQ